MTRKEIGKSRKFKRHQKAAAMHDRSFREFKNAFNHGEIDLSIDVSQNDSFYVDVKIVSESKKDIIIKQKAERKERYQKYKQVKSEWRAKIEVEYSSKPLFCPLCGSPITPNEKINPDHKIPRVHGGTDTLENLQATHVDCNVRRGSNKLYEKKFYDTRLKANVERCVYMDIHRTKWNVTIRHFENNPVVGVFVKTKTNSGHFEQKEIYYTIEGNRINRKSKQDYYNHSNAHYKKIKVKLKYKTR